MAQGEKNGRPEGRVDRRVRRSRRTIVEAFDRLIMTLPLEEITVSAVAREADVDRKTFYQHFGTIDGLLDAIAEGFVTELLDEVELAMAADAAPGEASRPLRAFFVILAEHLNENLLLRQRYCEHVPPEIMFDHLSRPLVRQVVGRGFVREGLPDEELEMLLAFGLGGLFSLYRWWLLSDRRIPVEEVASRACQLVESGVSPLLRDAGGAVAG